VLRYSTLTVFLAFGVLFVRGDA